MTTPTTNTPTTNTPTTNRLHLRALMILALGASPSLGTALAVTTPSTPVLRLFVVTKDTEGKEVLTPAGQALRPGSLIERQMTIDVQRVTNKARMVLNIDQAYIYQKGSDVLTISGKPLNTAETAARLSYSLNLGASAAKDFNPAPMKTVEVTENGVKVSKQVLAQPQDFRAVSYDLGDLKPGDSVMIKQRVMLR